MISRNWSILDDVYIIYIYVCVCVIVWVYIRNYVHGSECPTIFINLAVFCQQILLITPVYSHLLVGVHGVTSSFDQTQYWMIWGPSTLYKWWSCFITEKTHWTKWFLNATFNSRHLSNSMFIPVHLKKSQPLNPNTSHLTSASSWCSSSYWLCSLLRCASAAWPEHSRRSSRKNLYLEYAFENYVHFYLC